VLCGDGELTEVWNLRDIPLSAILTDVSCHESDAGALLLSLTCASLKGEHREYEETRLEREVSSVSCEALKVADEATQQ
jgi:hypothetical protein